MILFEKLKSYSITKKYDNYDDKYEAKMCRYLIRLTVRKLYINIFQFKIYVERFTDSNLLISIVFIGIPFLIYCIVTS